MNEKMVGDIHIAGKKICTKGIGNKNQKLEPDTLVVVAVMETRRSTKRDTKEYQELNNMIIKKMRKTPKATTLN